MARLPLPSMGDEAGAAGCAGRRDAEVVERAAAGQDEYVALLLQELNQAVDPEKAQAVQKSVDGYRRGRPLNIGIRAVGWCLMMSASAMSLVAQPASEAAFRSRAQQLEWAVYQRPRAGATFDLWYEHYSRANRQTELVARVDRRRQEAPQDAGAQMVWGLVCERQSDWPAATRAFRQVARLTPDDYYPRARLAEALLRADRPNEAAGTLSEALARDVPRTERLSLARQLARLYLRLGDRAAAIEVYADVAGRFARDVRVVSEMATQLQQLGEIDRARQLWQDVQQHSRDPETRFQSQWQLARLARQSGDGQAALEQFTQLLDQVKPQSWRAVELERALNQTLVETRGVDGPADFWQQRFAQRPDDLAALLQATEALADANRLQEAASLFEQAIERAPTRRDLQLGLIELLARQGKTTQAVDRLQKLIQQHPDDIELWLVLGQYQLQQTHLAEEDAQRQAIAAWRRAIELRSDDGDLALRVAQITREAAENRSGANADLPPTATMSAETLQRNPLLWQATESFYREATRRDPSPTHRENLVEFLHRTGQTKAAVETALAIGRNSAASTWRDAARMLERFGYLDAARQAAQAAVDADPRELEGWKQWLDVLLAQHDYPAALDAIQRMRAIRPHDDDWQRYSWQVQASTMIAAGSIDDQIQSLQAGLADRPEDVGTLWVLAQLKEAAGERSAALDTMRRITELRPDDADVRRRYAAMLAADDQLSLAAQQYQQLIDLPAPDGREDFQRLIDLQLRLGRGDDAEASADRFSRQSPRDPEAYLLQAQVAAARQQTDGQLAALKRAVQVAPRDAQALRQYAQALVDAGRTAEALDVTDQLLAALKSVPQRQATLAWVLTWATSPEQHDRVQEHLRQQRLSDEPSAAEAWTHCLAFWLTETGDPEQALTELEALLARSGANRTLLEQLVTLAELTRDLDRASRFQQQIVRLDASPSAREKLARLYRQTGRIDDARQIWDQIVDQAMSASEAISLVDQLLRREDFFAAQRVAEAGVSHDPDNWRLVYRAGLLHLAMEQYSAARETLESLLMLPPEGADVAAGAPRSGGLELMRLSLAANREFSQLTTSRHTLGARHARTLQQFSRRELLEPDGRSSLEAARVFAAVACVSAMPESVTDAERLAQLAQSAGDPASLRAVLAAFWATDHHERAARLASSYRKGTDDDLLHWLRLLTFSTTGTADGAALRDLTASHDQLQQRYPNEGRQLMRLYVHHLTAAAAHDDAWKMLERQVAAAPQIGWLVDLASLSNELAPPRREQLLAALMTRAAELEAGDSAVTTSATDMRQWLRQLATWNEVAIEPRVDMMAQWLPHYLLQSLRQRPLRPGIARPSRTTPLSEFADQLAESIQADARRRRYAPSTTPKKEAVEVDQVADRPTSRQRLLQVLRADRSRQLRDDGTVVVSAQQSTASPPLTASPSESLFPTATRWLDHAALQTLVHVADQSPAPAHRQRLIRELASAVKRSESLPPAGDDDPAHAAPPLDELQPALALQLARAMLHWVWQEYDEAFKQLEEISLANPRNLDLKTLTLRATLERDRLDEAQRLMNELSPSADTSSEIRNLQRVLRHRWTKRLHWQDLIGHAGAVSDLAVDPNGERLASVGVDGTVRVWDVKTGRQLRLLQDQGDLLLAVAFSPDGHELAAAGYDRTIRRWRANDGAPLPSLIGHQATVRTVDYARDGRLLVSGSDDDRLIVWNLSTGQVTHRLDGHRGAVLSARFTPDGRRIVSSSRDQTLRWWNVADGQLQATVSTPQGTIRSVWPLETLDGVLAAGDDGRLRVWGLPQAETAGAPTWPTISAGDSIGDLARRANTPLVAFGGDDRLVQVWDLPTGREQFSLAGHTGRVLSVAWSPDGQWLASAGFDGIIKLWRLK